MERSLYLNLYAYTCTTITNPVTMTVIVGKVCHAGRHSSLYFKPCQQGTQRQNPTKHTQTHTPLLGLMTSRLFQLRRIVVTIQLLGKFTKHLQEMLSTSTP